MTGPDRLRTWRERVVGSHSTNAGAKRLGVDWAAYKSWEDGTGRPGLDMANRLFRELGIPQDSWPTADEAAAARKVRDGEAA